MRLHRVFYILSHLLLLWFKITSSIPTYKCLDKERDALLNFKANIHQDPHGLLSNWTRQEEGGATNDCCHWRGVKCNNQSRVTRIDLSRASLDGMISHSLLNLSYLHYLNLGWNNFSGTIPPFIGSLTQLRNLDLGWNDFTGTIPLEFGNLTNLQLLSLDSISLAKSNIWANVILRLRKLSILSLVECDLSQVTHPYSYSSMNSSLSISYLDLSGNNLDGIPKYLGNLCGLEYLGFQENSMSIKFSDFLNNFSGCTTPALLELYASGSQFTGSLPDDIQKFSALRVLYVADNKLNGTISEKVWELPNLGDLDLSFNSLQGVVFKNIGSSKIMRIVLSNNSLDGFSSYDDMSSYSNSKEIDLHSNNIYGPIPSFSSSVIFIDFSNNKLYGSISFLCKIVDSLLEILDLSDNSLAGQIPDCLWHFRKLKILNLGENKLFGRLPASIGSLTSLMGLYLNNNNFFGELPLSLKNFTELTFMYLGGNRFSGNVPLWIGDELPLLQTLSLTSNNFHGTIPLQLCQLVELQVLDLSINNLNGSIPTCLNNLTTMVQDIPLPLQYNDFDYRKFDSKHLKIRWQGKIREFSTNLELVKIIDLSRNKLAGKIPDELTDLHGLIALDLSMNTLYGEIPSKIDLMKELQILDLSKNNLSGVIPSNMSQMSLLNYLDVSYNNLSGRIPTGTQLQSFTSSMYTGNEGLCGPPLIKACPGDKEPPLVGESEVEGEGIEELERWFYIGGTVGFSIGFWITCSGLLLYRRGRHAFFHYMNRLEDWVYVEVMVFIAKLKRITHP